MRRYNTWILIIGFIVLATFASFSYDVSQSSVDSQSIEIVYDTEKSEIEISLDGIPLFRTNIDGLNKLNHQVNNSHFTSLELTSNIYKPPITPIFS